jgi:O-antigen/teichoic acid export membrane protein
LGALAFATAFAGYVNLVADFGLTTLGTREIAKDDANASRTVSAILALQVLVALAAMLISSSVILLLPLSTGTRLVTLILCAVVVPSAFNLSYIFQGYERMHLSVASRLFGQAVYLAAALSLIAATHSVVGVALAMLSGAVGSAALAGALFRHAHTVRLGSVPWNAVLGIGRKGFPFVIGALFIQVYTSADSVMLQFMKGQQVVGLYAAPYKVVLTLLSVSGLVTWALYPRLTAVFQSDRTQFDSLVAFSFKGLEVFVVPTVVGGIALRQGLVSLIFGPLYGRSADVLAVLFLLLPVMVLNSTIGSAMSAAGKQSTNTVGVGIAAVGSVALGLLLIPRFDMIGAAVGSLVAEVVVAAYLLRAARGTLDVSGLSRVGLSILFGAGVMAATMFLLPGSPTKGLIAGVAFYVCALLSTGGLRLSETKRLLGLGALRRPFGPH